MQSVYEIQLLTVKDVAKMLVVSVRQVYRLVSDGQLPKPIKVGNLNRFNLADVEKYLGITVKDEDE